MLLPDTHRSAQLIVSEDPCPSALQFADSSGPPVGFGALRRSQKRAATYAELASPGCAAPSGFLNLLTRYSTRNPSGLVSCR